MLRLTSLTLMIATLTLAGCATQDYVREQIVPVQTQVGELRDRTAGNESGLKALDGRVKTSEERIAALQQEALARAQAAAKATPAPVPTFAMSTLLSDDRVKFRNGHAELSAQAVGELDQLIAKLKTDNQPVFLEIQGHTDANGPEDFNQRLGLQRAEAVRLYLARAGVPLARMATISYGESAPMADNRSADGRSQNRRVQLVVMR
ncbi:OmpA family protein [Roseateles sp. DJS-2-20]|uniref:OmpA family protein n=2 Tax=Roseateles paludis TaxID=3145238 RepID=A0ABV0G5F5_9BURK